MVQIFKEEIEILKVKAKTACPAMTFQPIQRASINAMNNHGGNAIGIESDGPLTREINPEPAVFDFVSVTNYH